MTVRIYNNAADVRAKANSEWHEEWISKSGLKARLWTDKATSDFLGAPAQRWTGKGMEAEGSKKGRSNNRFQSMAGTASLMAHCAR